MNNFKRIFSLVLLLTLVLSSSVFADTAADLSLVGTSAIAVDYDTGEIIYANNIDDKTSPASITKLMTGLLLAENMSKSDKLTYTQSAYDQPPFAYRTQIHPVEVGDQVNAVDAMDMLLIYSANDIAYMIAENVAGSPEAFVQLMNDKAKELGMNNTLFVKPNGLDDGEIEPYSTAYDIYLLTKAAYANDWVKESIGKAESKVGFINAPKGVLKTRNSTLGIDGNVGGKTGYTAKAGRCLTAIYERDGRTIIGVVLNSEYNLPEDTIVFQDMSQLMDYSFSAEKETLHPAGEIVGEVTVSYPAIPILNLVQREVTIPLATTEAITYYDNGLELKESMAFSNPEDIDAWALSDDTSLGELTISQGDAKVNYSLISTITKEDIKESNKIIYIIAGVLLVLALLLVIVIIVSIKRKLNKKNRYQRRF